MEGDGEKEEEGEFRLWFPASLHSQLLSQHRYTKPPFTSLRQPRLDETSPLMANRSSVQHHCSQLPLYLFHSFFSPISQHGICLHSIEDFLAFLAALHTAECYIPRPEMSLTTFLFSIRQIKAFVIPWLGEGGWWGVGEVSYELKKKFFFFWKTISISIHLERNINIPPKERQTERQTERENSYENKLTSLQTLTAWLILEIITRRCGTGVLHPLCCEGMGNISSN